MGVHYGASPGEARHFAGKRVYLVGAGNSAGQAAMHLARFASSVTILVRSGSLAQSMSEYLVNEIDAAPIVGVRYHTEVLDGGGESRLEWLDLRDRRTGEVERVPAAAIFVLIGAQPFTDWLPGSVARDQWGYVLTGDALSTAGAAWPQARTPLPFETSLPGVFAIGDVRHGSVKRVASAVGEGSVAITSVHEYLAMIL
jgi:thioredoxin reductase (NADPH)